MGVCAHPPLRRSIWLIVSTGLLLVAGTLWAQQRSERFKVQGLRLDRTRLSEIRVTAQRLQVTEAGTHLLLTGGVHLVGDELDVRADWMEVFTGQERVVLAGSVRVVDGQGVVLAERLELYQADARWLMSRAVLVLKRAATHAQLASCKTASGLRQSGIEVYRLQGERWVRKEDAYQVEGARFSPCDCGQDEAPSWELRATEADVIPDDRAWLKDPILYIKGLPVFALPVAYLPMGERKSGLLMPQFNYSGRDGFFLSESLFLTLGQQADTSLSLDWIEERGFRQRLELRAAPARRSWIVARFSFMDDQKAQKGIDGELDPDGKAYPNRARSERGTVEFDAWADLGRGFSWRSEIRLYSDSDINRDFVSELAGQAADYAPSRLALSWRSQDHLLEFDLGYLQDFRLAAVDQIGGLNPELVELRGMDPVADTIQRLGAISWRVVPTHVFAWPLRLGLLVEGANLSALGGAWGDWGVDGTPDGREPSYKGAPTGTAADKGADNLDGDGDGLLGPGELRRAFRFLFEPELSWPQRVGNYLWLEGRLAHRQLVYLPHGPDAPGESTRGISFASVELASELSRGYGQDRDRFGHVLRPFLRVAGAWRGLQTGGPAVYLDLQDRLMSDAVQLSLGADTWLFRRVGKGGFERAFGLSLEQGFDLRRSDPAQLTAGLQLTLFPVDLGLRASVDWQQQDLVEVDGRLHLFDRRGDYLRASYLYLPSFTDELGRPLPLAERTQLELDLLFGDHPLPYRGMGDGLHVVELGASLVMLWGFRISGGVHLNLAPGEDQSKLTYYGAGLAYKSDCHCWGISASFRKLSNQDFPDLFFLLDLGPLGRAGGGTATRF